MHERAERPRVLRLGPALPYHRQSVVAVAHRRRLADGRGDDSRKSLCPRRQLVVEGRQIGESARVGDAERRRDERRRAVAERHAREVTQAPHEQAAGDQEHQRNGQLSRHEHAEKTAARPRNRRRLLLEHLAGTRRGDAKSRQQTAAGAEHDRRGDCEGVGAKIERQHRVEEIRGQQPGDRAAHRVRQRQAEERAGGRQHQAVCHDQSYQLRPGGSERGANSQFPRSRRRACQQEARYVCRADHQHEHRRGEGEPSGPNDRRIDKVRGVLKRGESKRPVAVRGRILAGQPARHERQLLARLLQRGSLDKTCERRRPARVARRGVRSEGHEGSNGRAVVEVETARHHAHDRVRLPVQHQRPADDVRGPGRTSAARHHG